VDGDIIRAARAGDSDARDELADWLLEELSMYFVSERGELDELIQETVLDIFRKLARAPDDPDAFRRFVHSFAGIEALTSTRERMREHPRVVEPRTPAESPSAIVLTEQQRQLVIEHAQRLPPVYCRAVLHVLDGGDYKSLAASEGIFPGTAANRISHGIAKLRRAVAAARRTRQSFQSPNS
jgi:DNA-directed RNA polymerase specialized sigma24 family protein